MSYRIPLKLLRPKYLKLLLSIKQKFILMLVTSLIWLGISIFFAVAWINYLAIVFSYTAAIYVVTIIALLPGFMNCFITVGYLLVVEAPAKIFETYPGISILIAAYNEEECITTTLESIASQVYPGIFEVIVIDDGSTDKTLELVKDFQRHHAIRLLHSTHAGKANALNLGLKHCQYDLVVTVDADTHLLTDSLYQLVAHLLSEEPNTVAVAGSIQLKNSTNNYLTKLQWWDYFNAIQAIKSVQGLFQGTLVAQGAFSIYRKKVLEKLGGWPNAIGEDIVLTWKMLNLEYNISYAERAIVLTEAPKNYKTFFYQRSRWARGLLEAFSQVPAVLIKKRWITFLVYWNLFFPVMDFTYLFIFTPGLIAAFFGYYYIAGPMTLIVLPLAILQNSIFFLKENKLFKSRQLKIPCGTLSFLSYILFYNFLMSPACVHGYLSYWLKRRRIWGTK